MSNQRPTGSGRTRHRFFESQSGSASIEYAIMLGLIGVALVPVVHEVGQGVNSIAMAVAGTLVAAEDSPSPVDESPIFKPAPETPEAPEEIAPDKPPAPLFGPAPEEPSLQ
jgi:Flp pilus assembly pilin Flp